MEFKNFLNVTGIVLKDPEFDHKLERDGKEIRFYKTRMKIAASLSVDTRRDEYFIMIFPEYFLDMVEVRRILDIKGKLYSYTILGDDGKKHLVVYVHPKEIEDVTDQKVEWKNQVFISGILKKDAEHYFYTQVPILEMILETHVGPPGRYLKIPCVALGQKYYSRELKAGEKVEIKGKIYSRFYLKDGVPHEVYEVKVKEMRKVIE